MLPIAKMERESLDPDIFTRLPVSYFETELGNFYVPAHAPNDGISTNIRAGKVFEPYVIEVAKSYVKPGTLLLDIGANFGQMSVLFSRLMSEGGMVFSFEAQAYCFAILQKNIQANQCANVRAFYGAVMEKGGDEVFFPEPDLSQFSTYGSYALSLKSKGNERSRVPTLFEYEERFQEEFETSFQDYVEFVQSVDYRFVKTIADINFLIMPAPPKTISVPALPEPASRFKQQDKVAITRPAFAGHLCVFLKTESEVQESTCFLNENGYRSQSSTPKNWALAHIIPEIGDGNILDMGSSDSFILRNVCLKKMAGKKYSLNWSEPAAALQEVSTLQGSLLQTPLPDRHLNYIACLSSLDNQIDSALFAKEAARLLAPGGKLFIGFDYWNPLVSVQTNAAGWQPLDRPRVERLIEECDKCQLRLVQGMDWSTQEPIIRPGYYSADPAASYTYGLLTFEKNK